MNACTMQACLYIINYFTRSTAATMKLEAFCLPNEVLTVRVVWESAITVQTTPFLELFQLKQIINIIITTVEIVISCT